MSRAWLDMSQLLDLHLSRSINRLKEPEGNKMALSKFRELAEAVRDDRKNFDKQADELLEERERLRRKGEELFSDYRAHHTEVNDGLRYMREMISDMEGANKPPPDEEKKEVPKPEGSDDSSENFQGKSDGGH